MKFTTIFYQKNRARIQCPFSKTIHYWIFSLSSPHKAGSTKYNCVDTFRAHIHFFAIQTWAQDHTQICLCIVNIRQLFDRLQPSTRTNPVNRGRSSFSCASSSSPQEKIHHHIESWNPLKSPRSPISSAIFFWGGAYVWGPQSGCCGNHHELNHRWDPVKRARPFTLWPPCDHPVWKTSIANRTWCGWISLSIQLESILEVMPLTCWPTQGRLKGPCWAVPASKRSLEMIWFKNVELGLRAEMLKNCCAPWALGFGFGHVRFQWHPNMTRIIKIWPAWVGSVSPLIWCSFQKV
jgi:hypothetical protein